MPIFELFKNIVRYIIRPSYRFQVNNTLGMYKNMPDREYLCRQFAAMGRKLDLDHPETFGEKIQWLKLYDRKPKYSTMADKYAVKQYVAERIGAEHVIPAYGVWKHFDDIDWAALPSQFVLKTTHDCGGICIVKDKEQMNYLSVREKLETCLRRNYYYPWREWVYKDIHPQILAEKYMKDAGGSDDLRDYKFYCFHGNPVYCQVISNRNTHETVDFFDMNWTHQEFTGLASPHKPFAEYPIPMPMSFSVMKDIARILSKNLIFARIDLYDIQDVVYFGEITFYPAGGYGEFYPLEWNKRLGDLIHLPNKKDHL